MLHGLREFVISHDIMFIIVYHVHTTRKSYLENVKRKLVFGSVYMMI